MESYILIVAYLFWARKREVIGFRGPIGVVGRITTLTPIDFDLGNDLGPLVQMHMTGLWPNVSAGSCIAL